jgi:microcystin degradation protein MlrC
MEKNVQLKYRLYRRRNGIFYWQENDSSKQGTLRTSDRREAERLLNAMNESHREPTLNLNLNLARAYLAAHDPKMAQRTWQAVMDEMATHGIPSTQARSARAFRSKHTIRSAISPSSKPPAKICSPSSTRTEIALLTICDDFTI